MSLVVSKAVGSERVEREIRKVAKASVNNSTIVKMLSLKRLHY